MKRVLINYPFSDSSNDEFSRIAGRDKINMWVAILLKHYHESNSVRFLFPNEFHDQKIDLEIHINCSQAISGAKKRIGLFMETPVIAPANSADNCAYYDLVISSDRSLLDVGNVILANLPCWDQDAPLYSMVDASEWSRNGSFSMIC